MDYAILILERHLRSLEQDSEMMKKEGKDNSREQLRCDQIKYALELIRSEGKL